MKGSEVSVSDFGMNKGTHAWFGEWIIISREQINKDSDVHIKGCQRKSVSSLFLKVCSALI